MLALNFISAGMEPIALKPSDAAIDHAWPSGTACVTSYQARIYIGERAFEVFLIFLFFFDQSILKTIFFIVARRDKIISMVILIQNYG